VAEAFRRLNFFAAACPAHCKHSAPQLYEGAAIAAKESCGRRSRFWRSDILAISPTISISKDRFFPVRGAHHTLDGSPKNSLHGVALSRLGERPLVA
jgi:hypothetical protein